MENTGLWTLGEGRVGWTDRVALKHIHHHTQSAGMCCMTQPAQSWCSEITWRGRMGGRVGGGRLKSEGTHVHPWLICTDVQQKPRQYCRALILQLKIIKCFKKLQHIWQTQKYKLLTMKIKGSFYLREKWANNTKRPNTEYKCPAKNAHWK